MVSSHHNYHLHHFRVKHRLTLIHFFFFQAEDGIRDRDMTGVQTCALPISSHGPSEEQVSPWQRASLRLSRLRASYERRRPSPRQRGPYRCPLRLSFPFLFSSAVP